MTVTVPDGPEATKGLLILHLSGLLEGVLKKVGALDPDANPTGPELSTAAQTFLEDERFVDLGCRDHKAPEHACIHCLFEKLGESARHFSCEAYHDKLMRDMDRFYDRSEFLEQLAERVDQLEAELGAGQREERE